METECRSIMVDRLEKIFATEDHWLKPSDAEDKQFKRGFYHGFVDAVFMFTEIDELCPTCRDAEMGKLFEEVCAYLNHERERS